MRMALSSALFFTCDSCDGKGYRVDIDVIEWHELPTIEFCDRCKGHRDIPTDLGMQVYKIVALTLAGVFGRRGYEVDPTEARKLLTAFFGERSGDE